MIKRLLNLSKNHSFFLFGARGTGKSTLLIDQLSASTFLNIDLLDNETERKFALRPNTLTDMLDRYTEVEDQFCIIDEVQKVPELLNIVHQQIFKKKCNFALTGSSARKLKRGGANMLAGRAFLFNLFPLTHQELITKYHSQEAMAHILTWGSLPEIFTFNSDSDKARFLNSYINTYLREEIIQEQVIRQIHPFRLFLDIAAQCNGEEINFLKLSRQVGVEDTTVKSYFSILEDTLIGFFLYPFNTSLRKRVNKSPRFYLFDIGVKRLLANQVIYPAIEQTEEYGKLFEHFIILECYRLIKYKENGYELSFIRTQEGAEIDLIISRPGKTNAYIEIKSSRNIMEDHLQGIKKISPYLPEGDYYCFSQDTIEKVINGVMCLPWQKGLIEVGL